MDGLQENPSKVDDLGVPPFQEMPIYIVYIYILLSPLPRNAP